MSNNIEMRTRLMPKMTNGEVEEYLERNDLIFIPVGVCETHGGLPLDCETIVAEALSLKMAEATDGIVLTNLPYFYAGATQVGRGTVQMSVADGMAYLGKIAHSLLKQGFRRQVYVTLHGPAYLTVGPVIRDFFDQTKVPALYIDMVTAFQNLKINLFAMEDVNDLFIGGYEIMGRLEEVPLNVPQTNSQHYFNSPSEFKGSTGFTAPLAKLAYQSGAVGYYFEAPWEHAPTPLLKTPEERSSHGKAGARFIADTVAAMDMPNVVKTLRQVDQFTRENVLPKYNHL